MTHKQPVGKRIPLAPLELVLVELQFYMVILVFYGLHVPSLAQHCRFLPLLRIVFHPQVPCLLLQDKVDQLGAELLEVVAEVLVRAAHADHLG